MSLKIPLLGPASHEQMAHFNHLGVLLQPLALENPEEPDVMRAEPHVGRPKAVTESGFLAAGCSKANTEAREVERKASFISEVSNWGWVGKVDSCLKADCPH